MKLQKRCTQLCIRFCRVYFIPKSIRGGGDKIRQLIRNTSRCFFMHSIGKYETRPNSPSPNTINPNTPGG